MKTCTQCHQQKALDAFSVMPKCKLGRNSWCRACVAENSRAWYQANLETCRAKSRVRTAEYRKRHAGRARAKSRQNKLEMRARIAEYKAHRGCERCHVTDPRVLDLHHRAGTHKTAAVSQLLYRTSWQKVLEEAFKCRVLCANCHRIEHAKKDIEETGT